MVVSVIIPIYNAEQYLDECIQSVVSQDFEDFEVLLINDGSTDDSGLICDRYALNDKRIKVFHKENAGVSAARNTGIENASGEWITFVDADDLIEQNFFFDLFNSISNTDLILQGFNYLQNGSIVKVHQYKSGKYNVGEFITNYQLYPDFSSACSKFYKMTLIKVNTIKFNENLKFGEDTLFNLGYLKVCKEILVLATTPYFYRVSSTGLSSTHYCYTHDKLFYERSRDELIGFNNDSFYEQSIKISLSRLITSLYYDTSITTRSRSYILKEVIERNYKVILDIYTDPKIKIFIQVAYYTKSYALLDFVLRKIIYGKQ